MLKIEMHFEKKQQIALDYRYNDNIIMAKDFVTFSPLQITGQTIPLATWLRNPAMSSTRPSGRSTSRWPSSSSFISKFFKTREGGFERGRKPQTFRFQDFFFFLNHISSLIFCVFCMKFCLSCWKADVENL